MTTRLPRIIFKGRTYIIDPRLKEFRARTSLQTIPFKTLQGDAMLSLAIRRRKFKKDELLQLF